MTKAELSERLCQILGSEELVARWWHTGNRYWDGETPYSIWIRNPEDVEKYVAFFCVK